MRIIHCEDFFHPDTGYQLNILAPLMQARGHEVIIVTSELDKFPPYLRDFFGKENIAQRDAVFTQETGVKVIRVPIFCYYSGRSIYKPGYFRFLDSLNPDFLYFHGEDTYLGIRALWRLRKFRCPLLFDDHMVDIASANPLYRVFRWGYRTFMAPIINKNKVIVMRTVDDDFVMQHYGIHEENAPYMGFGSNLSLFHPDGDTRIRMRDELGIPQDDFLFLYAGKMDESKGGLLLAQALRDKLPTNRPVSFLVIGNVQGFDESHAGKVEELFAQTHNRIVRLPTQPYRKLASYFQAADAALFPRQCSLTYFDVQACGLPVILEDIPVNIDRISHNNGLIFARDSVEDLRHSMFLLADMPNDQFRAMSAASSRYIEEHANYDHVADTCLSIMDEVSTRYYKQRGHS